MQLYFPHENKSHSCLFFTKSKAVSYPLRQISLFVISLYMLRQDGCYYHSVNAMTLDWFSMLRLGDSSQISMRKFSRTDVNKCNLDNVVGLAAYRTYLMPLIGGLLFHCNRSIRLPYLPQQQ